MKYFSVKTQQFQIAYPIFGIFSIFFKKCPNIFQSYNNVVSLQAG